MRLAQVARVDMNWPTSWTTSPSRIESTVQGGGGTLILPIARVETTGLSTKEAEACEELAPAANLPRTEAIAGATLTSSCLTAVVTAKDGIAENGVPSVERVTGGGPEVVAASEEASSTLPVVATGGVTEGISPRAADSGVGEGSLSVVSSGSRGSAQTTDEVKINNTWNGKEARWKFTFHLRATFQIPSCWCRRRRHHCGFFQELGTCARDKQSQDETTTRYKK
jgi:hypothetical protein